MDNVTIDWFVGKHVDGENVRLGDVILAQQQLPLNTVLEALRILQYRLANQIDHT